MYLHLKKYFTFFYKIKTEIIVLLILMCLGFILRIHNLTYQSLWADELHSVKLSRPDLGFVDIVNYFQTHRDPHPPFYFIMLNAWFKIVGYNELLAKLFPCFWGVLGLLGIYLLGREIGSKKCGLIAAILLLLNFFHIYYSQEIRQYSFMFFISCISYLFFIRSILTLRLREFLGYIIFTIWAMYCHYYGLVLLGTQIIFTGIYFIAGIEAKLRLTYAIRFCVTYVLLGLLYIPWIPTLINKSMKTKPWISTPPKTILADTFSSFFGEEPYLIIFVSCSILFVFIKWIINVNSFSENQLNELDKKYSLSIPLLFSWIFFGLFIPLLKSYTGTPMMLIRYEIIILPAVIILVALGITSLRTPLMVSLLLFSFLLMSYMNVFYTKKHYQTITKDQWREAVQMVLNSGNGKYKGKNYYVLSNMPFFFEDYFSLLGSNQKVITSIEKEKMNEIVNGRLEGKSGFWLLGGQWQPRKKYINKIKQKYVLKEEKIFYNASARLFEPKPNEDMPFSPDTHLTE